VDDESFVPTGLHKTNSASVWLLIKRTELVWNACQEFSYKINRKTAAIGVTLAFTGKKMFDFS